MTLKDGRMGAVSIIRRANAHLEGAPPVGFLVVRGVPLPRGQRVVQCAHLHQVQAVEVVSTADKGRGRKRAVFWEERVHGMDENVREADTPAAATVQQWATYFPRRSAMCTRGTSDGCMQMSHRALRSQMCRATLRGTPSAIIVFRSVLAMLGGMSARIVR